MKGANMDLSDDAELITAAILTLAAVTEKMSSHAEERPSSLASAQAQVTELFSQLLADLSKKSLG